MSEKNYSTKNTVEVRTMMNTKKNLEFKCCICGKRFNGYGNNPYPVCDKKNARCCDDCNLQVVIPARIKNMFNKENKIMSQNNNLTKNTVEVKTMNDILSLYNHDGIIRYIDELTEKKVPVYLWKEYMFKGKPVTGNVYVLGHTTICRNDEEMEVVMLSESGELEDCFGLPFIAFVHNAGCPQDMGELYKGCFNN